MQKKVSRFLFVCLDLLFIETNKRPSGFLYSRYDTVNQMCSALDEARGYPRSAVDAKTMRFSLQKRFWDASNKVKALQRVVPRLKNAVLRDSAKAAGKSFDVKTNPVDYRFIGEQTSAVRIPVVIAYYIFLNAIKCWNVGL